MLTGPRTDPIGHSPTVLLIGCRLIVFFLVRLQVVKTDPVKCFGMRVRKLREQLGVSQEALAIRAGVHRTYMGGIERGERNVSLKNIIRLAQALNVRPQDLFDEPEEIE